MKGRITEEGCLVIDRVGVAKQVTCKYKNGFRCGDHCVAFGEPHKAGKGFQLMICDDSLLFESLEDQRYSSDRERQLNLFKPDAPKRRSHKKV